MLITLRYENCCPHFLDEETGPIFSTDFLPIQSITKLCWNKLSLPWVLVFPVLLGKLGAFHSLLPRYLAHRTPSIPRCVWKSLRYHGITANSKYLNQQNLCSFENSPFIWTFFLWVICPRLSHTFSILHKEVYLQTPECTLYFLPLLMLCPPSGSTKILPFLWNLPGYSQEEGASTCAEK